MKYFRIFIAALSCIALFYIFAPNMLFGYLDAGTGSYMIQIIIASLAGGALALKIFWRRIYSFFKRDPSKSKKEGKNKT